MQMSRGLQHLFEGITQIAHIQLQHPAALVGLVQIAHIQLQHPAALVGLVPQS